MSNRNLDKHGDTAPQADLFGAGVISQARISVMRAANDKGCVCPVCDQFVKVYRRSITSTMARQLIKGYRAFGTRNWFHVRDVLLAGETSVGDFAKLEIWGFIEAAPHQAGEGGKRTSGHWRITEFGEAFALRRSKSDEYALVYNARFLGFDGASVDIVECLGKKFDYRELMGMPA